MLELSSVANESLRVLPENRRLGGSLWDPKGKVAKLVEVVGFEKPEEVGKVGEGAEEVGKVASVEGLRVDQILARCCRAGSASEFSSKFVLTVSELLVVEGFPFGVYMFP